MTTLVDGAIEIQVSFPKPVQRDQAWEGRTSFVGTSVNDYSNLFILGYDRGYGGLSGADIVSYYGGIYRVEMHDEGERISFENLLQWIHADIPEELQNRKYVGIELVGGKEWHRVEYIGTKAAGASIYYHFINNNYVFKISMKVIGDYTPSSLLYKQRYEDLQRMLASVKITTADFASPDTKPSN